MASAGSAPSSFPKPALKTSKTNKDFAAEIVRSGTKDVGLRAQKTLKDILAPDEIQSIKRKTIKSLHASTLNFQQSGVSKRFSTASVVSQSVKPAKPEAKQQDLYDLVHGSAPHDHLSHRFDHKQRPSVISETKSHRTRQQVFRHHVSLVILSQRFEMWLGVMIVLNFGVIAWETDVRRQFSTATDSVAKEVAKTKIAIISVLNILFLVFYTTECAARMFVQRCEFFGYMWNLFDLFIVFVGFAGAFFDAVINIDSEVQDFVLIRSLRMIRMLRASRILVSFDELYSLVAGLRNAMKTLMWAAGLIFMMLTMWSVLAVEYLHDYMADLQREGAYDTCGWCSDAFSSIMHANLSFFQIISGDGWSTLARPLINEHPWTALIFCAVIFTMVFGVLNLVIAVIVDGAAQAREQDIMNMACRKDASRAAAWDCFQHLVHRLDEDSDGTITTDELKHGLTSIPELAAYLTVMGVEEGDLEMVFDLLDVNGDGYVSHEEFADQLYKLKTEELSIAVCYVRHAVVSLGKQVQELIDSSGKVAHHLLADAIDCSSMVPQPLTITRRDESRSIGKVESDVYSSVDDEELRKSTASTLSVQQWDKHQRGSLMPGSKAAVASGPDGMSMVNQCGPTVPVPKQNGGAGPPRLSGNAAGAERVNVSLADRQRQDSTGGAHGSGSKPVRRVGFGEVPSPAVEKPKSPAAVGGRRTLFNRGPAGATGVGCPKASTPNCLATETPIVPIPNTLAITHEEDCESDSEQLLEDHAAKNGKRSKDMDHASSMQGVSSLMSCDADDCEDA